MSLGTRSLALLLGAGHGFVIAIALWRSRRNRIANRFLALLLVALGIALAPQILGFAGAYDRFDWLASVPFEVGLLVGPLIWFYTHRLLVGDLPPRWSLHLLPWLLQIAYYLFWAATDAEDRIAWWREIHLPVVVKVETLLAALLGIAYLLASYRIYRGYREWVVEQVSDSESYHLTWLRNFLIGTTGTYLLWIGFELVDEIWSALSYRQFFPFYLAVAALIYYLGIEGYRHANLRYPRAAEAETPQLDEPRPKSEPDWGALAARFAEHTRREALYLEPTLTLPQLARELCTNSWTLSRAVNLGLGESFSDFVNRLRVAEIQRKLAEPGCTDPLLELALSCGFSSKTSFNRSFKKLTGETPTAYRRRVGSAHPNARS